MNQKKAKAIRRYVRSMGRTMADFPLHHVNLTGKKLVKASAFTAGYGGIIPARYPANSFQHAYTLAKRLLAGIRTAVINERASLQAAGLAAA